ncbi:unnamed protein product [Dicrocoelium dendriticum]|nr:unnamed protein product [Dicrocoelium dendriticum]
MSGGRPPPPSLLSKRLPATACSRPPATTPLPAIANEATASTAGPSPPSPSRARPLTPPILVLPRAIGLHVNPMQRATVPLRRLPENPRAPHQFRHKSPVVKVISTKHLPDRNSQPTRSGPSNSKPGAHGLP